MKYRKLRIAWSVAWGVVAVLLIVFWMRSYYVADIFGCNKQRAFGMTAFSAMGRMMFAPGETRDSLKTLWASLPHKEIHDLKGFAEGSGFKIITGTPPRGPKHLGITFPHWFLVMTGVGVGAIPWFGWSLRFTLRTLLIATTLVAILLGLTMWMLHK